MMANFRRKLPLPIRTKQSDTSRVQRAHSRPTRFVNGCHLAFERDYDNRRDSLGAADHLDIYDTSNAT
jgi:hypothetical protein